MKNKNYSFKVAEDCRLLDFLIDHIPESRNTVKHLMGAGFAAADGISVTKFDHPLRAGQTVTVSSENAVRSSMPFGILYEDSDIIVINKSAGLLCVGNDREKERTAYRFLSDYMRAKNEGGRVYVIHRLDRDTSGIVMFEKSLSGQLGPSREKAPLRCRMRRRSLSGGGYDNLLSARKQFTHGIHRREEPFFKGSRDSLQNGQSREAFFPSRHRDHDGTQKPDQGAACRARKSDRGRQKIRCRNKSDTPPRASCV